MPASLVIHGGLSSVEGLAQRSFQERSAALRKIAARAYQVLQAEGARAGVLQAIRAMEDDALFNAGTGSRLQADGQVRMSAGLMDGTRLHFSGVVNVQKIQHPIDLAAKLAEKRHTVLAGAEATAFAQENGFAAWNPVTEERLQEHTAALPGESGTVGAVALDESGALFSGISTGGVGMETPGRVSDSPTVAGIYADARAAGVACTGVGEHIVNCAAAARTVVRVADGATLAQAVERTVAESNAQKWRFGLIALDKQGQARNWRNRWHDRVLGPGSSEWAALFSQPPLKPKGASRLPRQK